MRRMPASIARLGIPRPSLLPLLLVLAVLAAACGRVGLTETRQRITLDGRQLEVIVAGRDGMRGRDFGDADGMLFTFEQDQDPGATRFVMDGVTMPLDIAYFDSAGRWLGTTTMEPCLQGPCQAFESPAPFRYALEAPAGGYLMELPADAVLRVGGG